MIVAPNDYFNCTHLPDSFNFLLVLVFFYLIFLHENLWTAGRKKKRKKKKQKRKEKGDGKKDFKIVFLFLSLFFYIPLEPYVSNNLFLYITVSIHLISCRLLPSSSSSSSFFCLSFACWYYHFVQYSVFYYFSVQTEP